MRTVLAVLFGATFTVVTAWALGSILLRRLKVDTLYRLEERLLAFVVGSACLSAIVFALSAAHLARKGVFLALGLFSIGYALYSGAHRPKGGEFPPLAKEWKWLFGAVFGLFTILYFFDAMAPEMSADAMSYHLGFVANYYRAHGFVRIPNNFYAQLSEGLELLFFYAFAFGKHSAAALVHYAFLLAVTFLMVCYGRRIGHPAAGLAGALFFTPARWLAPMPPSPTRTWPLRPSCSPFFISCRSGTRTRTRIYWFPWEYWRASATR
jgi:hypothetical protein